MILEPIHRSIAVTSPDLSRSVPRNGRGPLRMTARGAARPALRPQLRPRAGHIVGQRRMRSSAEVARTLVKD